MKFSGWMTAIALGFSVAPLRSRAADAPPPFWQYAQTPPMGWNSWDCWGTGVTEAQTKANADYMAEKLASHGWRYVVVDIQWYEPKASTLDYRKDAHLILDANGRLMPAANRFPSADNGAGFKPLADYVHGKGLKFGIHLLRGIPRQAVKENARILGTNYHAADIANTHDTCAWNPDMFGVDMTKPGAQEYYNSVFALIASWDVDLVKVDDLSRPYTEHKPEIEAIRKAIDASGRAMVLSTSPGETPLADAEHVASHANMWRISDDFWDNWKLLESQFARCANWAPHAGPGHFPDADMIPFARVRAWKPKAKGGWSNFTKDEQVTLMTLWSIARSPLIFGGHLPETDDFTLSLITNDDVLAMNQHGTNARQLFRKDNLVAWTSDGPDGAKYVALFNLRDKGDADITVALKDVGVAQGGIVKDLWARKDLGPAGEKVEATVPPHGARLFRVAAK